MGLVGLLGLLTKFLLSYNDFLCFAGDIQEIDTIWQNRNIYCLCFAADTTCQNGMTQQVGEAVFLL